MSDTLKPCPKCKGTKHSWRHTQSGAYDFVKHVHEIRCGTTSCWSDVYATGSTREEAVANWNAGKLMFTTDERSYRAGIEAAARRVEKRVECGCFECQKIASIADLIRALPTPSTLPQEGGELTNGETE